MSIDLPDLTTGGVETSAVLVKIVRQLLTSTISQRNILAVLSQIF